MPKFFSVERKIIIDLRDLFPSMGAYRLAKKIANRSFSSSVNNATANKLPAGRSFYSILSVIRRLDAARKLATAGV